MSDEISDDEPARDSSREKSMSRNSVKYATDSFYSEDGESDEPAGPEPEDDEPPSYTPKADEGSADDPPTPPRPRKLLTRRKSQPTSRLMSKGSSYGSVPNVIDVSSFGASASPMLSILSYQSSNSNWSSLRSHSGQSGQSSKYIADRIQSANLKVKKEKMNSMKALQREVQELREQNRLLNRTVKRQDTEISRLGGTRGELPTILHAHNEEVRALKDKLRKTSNLNKGIQLKLDRRDQDLFKMRESNKSLTNLTQSKKLDQREHLQMELDDVKDQLMIRDQENSDMRHKLVVMEKSHRQQMSTLRGKQHSLMKKLDKATEEIEKLRDDIKVKEKLIHRSNIYAHRYTRRGNSSRMSGASSMVSLSRSHGDISEEEDDSRDSGKYPKSLPNLDVPKSASPPKSPDPKDDSVSGDSRNESEDGKAANYEGDNVENGTEISIGSMDRKNTFIREASESHLNEAGEEMGGTNPDEETPHLVKVDSPNEDSASIGSEMHSNLADRDHSFKSTRDFFQNNGVIIQEKQSHNHSKDEPNQTEARGEVSKALGHNGIHDMSEDDKLALWMPKGMSTPKQQSVSSRSSSIGSSSTPLDNQTPSPASRTSFRRRLSEPDEKPKLDSVQKVGLLAQLNAIDQSGVESKTNVYGESFNVGGYSPSFGPATKPVSVSFGTELGTQIKRDAGGFRAPLDFDQSLNSSIGSVTSRKTNLMEELFGPGAK